MIEVNPRASRTVPFVSKAIGHPLAKLAARVMAGKTLKELGFTEEVKPACWAIKESVFPFNKFHGQDILLSPEMRSTGEVMGLDDDLGIAFAKSQMAANSALPDGGKVFISVNDTDKAQVAALETGRPGGPIAPQTRGRTAERLGSPQERRDSTRREHPRRTDAARGRNQDPNDGGLHPHSDHDDHELRAGCRSGNPRSERAWI